MLSVIGKQVLPAYTRFAHFMEASYIPAGRSEPGISALPDGAKYYQFLLRRTTTTDLTAEKMIIHVIDEGAGFKLSDVPDPLLEENLLSTSGRGIFLMRAFMDEFDVLPGRTGGAEIVMSKKFPAAGSLSPNGQSGQDAKPEKEA